MRPVVLAGILVAPRPRRLGATLVLGLLVAMFGVVSVRTAAPAHACSCAWSDSAQQFAAADTVFEGRLVDVPVGASPAATDPMWSVASVFEVDRVFKGLPARRQTIWSSGSDAACGMAPVGGDPVLILAYTQPDGRSISTLCSGNRPPPAPAAWGAGTALPAVVTSPPEVRAGAASSSSSSKSSTGSALAWAAGMLLGCAVLAGVAVQREHRSRRQR